MTIPTLAATWEVWTLLSVHFVATVPQHSFVSISLCFLCSLSIFKTGFGQAIDVDGIFQKQQRVGDRLSERQYPSYAASDEEGCDTPCDPYYPYRYYNGTCNNLAHPCWGMKSRTHNRLLPPDFGNGLNSFREAAPGTTPLPNSRLVSRVVHQHDHVTSRNRSFLFTGWSQFIDHDFAFTPLFTETGSLCNGIVIPAGDPNFQSPGCMSYFPSQPIDCRRGRIPPGNTCGCVPCLSGQAQFLNSETSYIDASSIYGYTPEVVKRLRVPNSALLRVGEFNLPPKTNNSFYTCTAKTCADSRCYDMGEPLNNQNLYVFSLQTIFIREHNRLVDRFSSVFGDPETTFQEVRKVIGAKMQHITYNEELPVLLGTKCMSDELRVPSSQRYQYDPSVDAGTLIECISGPCRFGHTEIQGIAKLMGRPLRQGAIFSDLFSLDFACFNDSIEKIVGGSLEQPALADDQYMGYEITNRLRTPFWPTLVDLVATDVERGRNHGVQGYTTWRRYCGLSVPKTYEELKELMPDDVVQRLRQLYGEDGIDNIDYMSPSVSEYKDENCADATVGPTYSCILTEFFRRLKRGDRFWYENQNHPGAFTTDQLNQIRKTTLSGILCRNTRLVDMQENALLLPSSTNLVYPCKTLADQSDIDPTFWR